MADLSADAPIRILGEGYTERFALDSSNAQTVYKGHPMMVIQGTDATGPLVAWNDSVVDPTDVFMGIAAEGKTIASGADETKDAAFVEVYVGPTIVGFKDSVFSKGADYGAEVYMSDSSLLSKTIGDNPRIGKVHCIRDGYTYVQLASPYICAGA